jgi:aspartate aminotransferase
MGDYQSQSTGSPSSISQYAAQVALTDCEKNIEQVVHVLLERKNLAIEEFKMVPELKLYIPDGAFYLWVDLQQVIGREHKGQIIQNSKDFCDILLNQYFVATVPGSECGSEGYMRLSFACSTETMQRAIARMKEFISNMSK